MDALREASEKMRIAQFEFAASTYLEHIGIKVYQHSPLARECCDLVLEYTKASSEELRNGLYVARNVGVKGWMELQCETEHIVEALINSGPVQPMPVMKRQRQ